VSSPGRRACAATIALALCCACTVRRAPRPVSPAPAGPAFGLYRAELRNEEGRTRRFRLLLYAAPPDRIHAEVLSPTSATLLVLDGGAGRVALSFVRERVAYVGDAGPAALHALAGLELSTADLVRGLLGAADAPAGVHRSPQDRPGLPDEFALDGAGGALRLRLVKLKPLRGGAEALGRGEPSPGMEQRPLEELTSESADATLADAEPSAP